MACICMVIYFYSDRSDATTLSENDLRHLIWHVCFDVSWKVKRIIWTDIFLLMDVLYMGFIVRINQKVYPDMFLCNIFRCRLSYDFQLMNSS